MKKIEISAQVPVMFLREGKTFIAYSPALDIATAGTSHNEAKKRFTEFIDIFFDELVEHGKLEEALLDLGWQKTPQGIKPPLIVSQDQIGINYAPHHAHSLAKV